MSQSIAFHFTGDNLNPAAIRAGELAALLEAIEDVLSAVVISKHPTLTKDNLVIGLSALRPGSIYLDFTTQLPELVIPAFQDVSNAILSGNPRDLPSAAYVAIDSLLKFIEKKNAQVDLILVNGTNTVLATVTPDFRIPRTTYISGETTLYGELVRVGGVEPKAEIKTVGGRVLFCPFDKELSSELGGLLYQQVGVKGQAKWDSETYEICEFRISELTPYRQAPITQVFAELRELAGDYFNDVDDVVDYVSKLRQG